MRLHHPWSIWVPKKLRGGEKARMPLCRPQSSLNPFGHQHWGLGPFFTLDPFLSVALTLSSSFIIHLCLHPADPQAAWTRARPCLTPCSRDGSDELPNPRARCSGLPSSVLLILTSCTTSHWRPALWLLQASRKPLGISRCFLFSCLSAFLTGTNFTSDSTAERQRPPG
jgi:hypothetical protein